MDLFVPACPPHPVTLLDGLLACWGDADRPAADAAIAARGADSW